MSGAKVQIGSVTLKTPQRLRILSEYARWYDEIEAQPQTVPIMATVKLDGTVEDNGVAWAVEGPVVSSDWSPCYGGVPFADGRNRNLGQTRRYSARPYAHALARALVECGTLEDAALVHTLAPGFEAVRVDFEYNGEQHHTFKIRRKS